MEYQTVINLLDNTRNQPTKFRTKKWVEINDESGTDADAQFTKCISRINNTQVGDAQYIDVVMPVYNLIE